jgi:hypothetical protein
LGGQKLVAVTVMEVPGLHHVDLRVSQAMVKHAPHDTPLLKSAVLSAVVRVPYPAPYRLPYPQAPPGEINVHNVHVSINNCNNGNSARKDI